MATGCPCGATPKSEYGLLDYLTDDLIDAAVNSDDKLKKFKGLLLPFIASAIWVDALCQAPRVQMPELSIVDFVNPVTGWPKVADALNCALYPLLCDCTPCPPITNCGMGPTIVVCSSDGYVTEPPLLDRRYHIPTGADLWVANSNTCLGNKNGIWIYWYFDGPLDTVGHVNVRDGNDGAPGDGWYVPDGIIGECITISFGDVQKPSADPWPAAPEGVADWLGPPPCSTSDICTALDYLYQTVRRTEFLSQVAAGPTYGVTTPYLFSLPGVNQISGTLAETLPRVMEALAPVQRSQLVNPETVTITEPSFIELDNVGYIDLELVTVPDWMGHRGADETLKYEVTGVAPGPGYLVVMGQAGVLAYYDIKYGEGLEFALGSTATGIALQLTAGVEVEMTTWERHV